MLTEDYLQNVAKRTMLPLDELKMHVDHLRLTAERHKAKQRGEGTKKTATTKKAKKKKGKSSCKWFIKGLHLRTLHQRLKHVVLF